MNNRLNTIGLSTLVISALIAMGSLGYTMAAANQATVIEESAPAPVISLRTDVNNSTADSPAARNSVRDNSVEHSFLPENFIAENFIAENFIAVLEPAKCENELLSAKTSNERSRTNS